MAWVRQAEWLNGKNKGEIKMKVKVEVIEKETGKALAEPVMLECVDLCRAMEMVDETWLKDSDPASTWRVICGPSRRGKRRAREWMIGSKIGLRTCRVTTLISTL